MSFDPQTPSAAPPAEQHFDTRSPSPTQHDAFAAPESPPSLVQSTPLQPQCAGLMTPVSERHPKGKRKRTPTKDKVILEEAYLINPKPDKQARSKIVGRVTLTEKEVQIWFQNRRQNDRRKSRPLSPQELAALRFCGLHGTSDPVLSQGSLAESDTTFHVSDPALTSSLAPFSPQHSGRHPHSHPSNDAVNATPRFMSHNTSASSLDHVTPPQRQDFASSQESQDSTQFSQSFASPIGYLANRWNVGSSFSTPSNLARRNDALFKLESFRSGSYSSPPSRTASPPTMPQMRLSLSLEGKAEIVSDVTSPEIETPSRPGSTFPDLPQVPPRSLQRSYSALPTITLPPISTLTNSLPPRLGRGRSRDVQAWELCADSDTRDGLITQAEHESNGSAVAAISLLRCKAGGVLQPSGTKRNAPVAQLHQIKKPKLGRASSDVSCWERARGSTGKPREALGGQMNVSMLISPADSDKENWSPGGDGNLLEGRRRPLPASPLKLQNPRRPSRVLQSSFLSNRANTAPSALLRGMVKEVEIFRDEDGKTDAPREDEVGRPMPSEESPIKKGDMDCVAGLLSLSQGAWR